jgi:hypothetical protein
MMRLPRLPFTALKLLITLLIAADLFALWVWATRPPLIYSEWLGLVGFTAEAPIPRLVAWANWEDGPRTPSGCLALFETGEVFFAAVFVFALVLLILILLAPRRTERPLWRRLSAPISLVKACAVRFRVRTALALIAIFGLYLGWEIQAWRTWQLRSNYSNQAALAANGEERTLSILKSRREQLAKVDQFVSSELADLSSRGFYRSKIALAAERLANKHRGEREISFLWATAVAHSDRRRKYERAAADPWSPVAPEEPLPAPILDAHHWLANRDYARALAACDELARTYPDLFEAHEESAWIRATCRDALYRDGKLAVASATRAGELSNWMDTHALAVLAAACAEAGDFTSAVKWQQKAMALTDQPASAQSLREALALYLAGQPYRQK